jgi:hypothetical protein
MPIRIDGHSSDSGYVALIFLDPHGKELGRQHLSFEPLDQLMATVKTDSRGRFFYPPSSQVLRTSGSFRAEFDGDAQHRMAFANLP